MPIQSCSNRILRYNNFPSYHLPSVDNIFRKIKKNSRKYLEPMSAEYISILNPRSEFIQYYLDPIKQLLQYWFHLFVALNDAIQAISSAVIKMRITQYKFSFGSCYDKNSCFIVFIGFKLIASLIRLLIRSLGVSTRCEL